MKKLTLLLSLLVLNLSLYAADESRAAERANIKPLTLKQIKKKDRHLNKQRAKKRIFYNRKEFTRQHKRHPNPGFGPAHRPKHYKGYDKAYPVPTPYVTPIRQRGYRYSKRGWALAYRYDRAEFFDRHGYHYGFFNRHGYYFEGVFYRYDKGYTYRDRVRGRGLFERRYYMPANARFYGFAVRPHRGF
ncbi:MAG: hypothetical protein ABXS92_08930 [Sulfurimonas sp.]